MQQSFKEEGPSLCLDLFPVFLPSSPPHPLLSPSVSSRDEALLSTYFETVDDLLESFGPVRDCSKDNGGCKKNFKCVSDRRLESSGCMVSGAGLPPPKGSRCALGV